MNEVLVIASKVKKHVKDKSGMSTSASVMQALTRKIQEEIDKAIERARASGRKTVMDRDFED